MDQFTKAKIQKLFKRDEVVHDNAVFRLHHQVNFFFVLVGVLFIFGENYLNGKSIVCKGGNSYVHQYCWLHGSGYLPDDLSKAVSGCVANQDDLDEDDKRHTHYYLWLPFVLGICLMIIKIPRVFWKNICERGLMETLVQQCKESKEKMSIGHLKRRSLFYFVSFTFNEILNVFSVILCLFVVDTLLGGKFMMYGSQIMNFYNDEERHRLKKTNPMCNVFPTEVSCFVDSGAATGAIDKANHLCILSNNLFNQYYFLILWIWWMFLITISVIGLLYRAIQFVVPSATAAMFRYSLIPYGLESKVTHFVKLKSWDYFLLSRIMRNLTPEEKKDLLIELINNAPLKTMEDGIID